MHAGTDGDEGDESSDNAGGCRGRRGKTTKCRVVDPKVHRRKTTEAGGKVKRWGETTEATANVKRWREVLRGLSKIHKPKRMGQRTFTLQTGALVVCDLTPPACAALSCCVMWPYASTELLRHVALC